MPGLFVISRNAAFSYKGKVVPPAQINKELGVRYILEGNTRRVADEMRIDAQLVDAQTGGYIWAQRFDGPWAGVFALSRQSCRKCRWRPEVAAYQRRQGTDCRGHKQSGSLRSVFAGSRA